MSVSFLSAHFLSYQLTSLITELWISSESLTQFPNIHCVVMLNLFEEQFHKRVISRIKTTKECKDEYENDWWFYICIPNNWNVMNKISATLIQLSLYYWSRALKELQRIWRGVKRWSIIKIREMCCWWLWREGRTCTITSWWSERLWASTSFIIHSHYFLNDVG